MIITNKLFIDVSAWRGLNYVTVILCIIIVIVITLMIIIIIITYYYYYLLIFVYNNTDISCYYLTALVSHIGIRCMMLLAMTGCYYDYCYYY